jgi:hypothetical protein
LALSSCGAERNPFVGKKGKKEKKEKKGTHLEERPQFVLQFFYLSCTNAQ